MTDIPTLANIESDVMLGGSVELHTSSATAATGGSSVNDRFTALRSYSYEVDPPDVRIDHGWAPSYFYNIPNMLVRFSLSATHDVFAYIRTRSLVTRGVIKRYKYALKWTSVDNETKYVSFQGYMGYKRSDKQDGQQHYPVEINGTIRVADTSEPAVTDSL